jgi:hypothetical protein
MTRLAESLRQTAGLAVGPAIAGEIITHSEHDGLIGFAAIFLLLPFFLMMITFRITKIV